MRANGKVRCNDFRLRRTMRDISLTFRGTCKRKGRPRTLRDKVHTRSAAGRARATRKIGIRITVNVEALCGSLHHVTCLSEREDHM